MRPLLAAAAALACALALNTAGPAAAAPDRRALLIGVSDYPADKVGDLQLAGPKYDVALVWSALVQSGVPQEAITTLADGMDMVKDGPSASETPTRAAILAALERFVAEAKPGQQVLIYLSGHGSQSPELDPDAKRHPEADGLDEIFLPIDIGTWNDTVGAVENAILDDELGARIAAMRAKGASVWLVVDACHSGTLTRASGDGSVARQVTPALLGVPQERLDAARKRAADRAPATRGGPAAAREPTIEATGEGTQEGGYVAFYAAHAGELALQRNLPRTLSADVERRPHGVLTFYLVQAMRAGRAATYRDLAFQIIGGYEQFGATAPTPLFEGDLTAPVFGTGATGPQSWPGEGQDDGTIRLQAGALDGIAEGAVFSLVRADRAEEPPFAYARAREVSASAAVLETIDYRDTKTPERLPNRTLVARLEERAVGLELTVARPDPATLAAAPQVAAAIDAAVEGASAKGLALTLTGTGGPADLFLFVEGGKLFLVQEGAQLRTEGRSPSPFIDLKRFAASSALSDEITGRLTRYAKARNLVRVAGALAEGPVSQSLEITPYLFRPAALPLPDGAPSPDARPCTDFPREGLPEEAIAFAELAASELDVIDLVHCDVVYFRLRNIGEKPIDVTPLYIDGEAGVSYMGPREGIRLLNGEPPVYVPLRIVTWSLRANKPLAVGLERMLFVAVEQGDRTAIPADFRYLAQPSIAQTATRGGGASALRGLLENAAFNGAGLRAATTGGAGEAGIFQFRWRVAPPAEGETDPQAAE